MAEESRIEELARRVKKLETYGVKQYEASPLITQLELGIVTATGQISEIKDIIEALQRKVSILTKQVNDMRS